MGPQVKLCSLEKVIIAKTVEFFDDERELGRKCGEEFSNFEVYIVLKTAREVLSSKGTKKHG